MATTLESEAGGLPLRVEPQPITFPSARNARLWEEPAEMATILVRPAGALGEAPQETSVPSLFRAMLWESPPAMATTLLNDAGTFVALDWKCPHATTLPSSLRARA